MDYSASGMYHSLRKIINVVDDLRDIGLHQYINLPRIAVLGTQSSGKSSLLEMIVGIDFLPRGEVSNFDFSEEFSAKDRALSHVDH